MDLDQSGLFKAEETHTDSYFTEITPFNAKRAATPLSQIEVIVGVRGDTRRGQKPFPHPFPARMPMDVARAAVEALTRPGETVLDPMAGSGVVPRASLALGRKAVGIDIDPLAVIQSRALCAFCKVEELTSTANKIHAKAVSLAGKRNAERAWSELSGEDQKFVTYWFERAYAIELFALSYALDDIATSPLWPVLATIFSSLIISRGSGASRAMDLSRSRPHLVDGKVTRSPFVEWQRKVDAFCRYYEAKSDTSLADLRLGDARDLRIADNSVDAVITSPPYVNAIDYMRTSKFTLIFLGSRLSDLRAIRAASIGSEVGLPTGNLPKDLDKLVDSHVTDPGRRPMLRRYIRDLRDALSECHRVLRPDGQALYVMGPSILSRRDYDAATVLSKLAEDVGFTTVCHGRRDLDAARRSLPPPRRSQRGQSINKRMSCEYYIVLAKETD